MTSKTGQQIITIHMLPNISRSKGNQAMKFGQLENIARDISLFKYKSCRNEAEILVSDLFLLFEKASYKVSKQVVSTSVLTYFGNPRLDIQ